jgi:hypothetical protein
MSAPVPSIPTPPTIVDVIHELARVQDELVHLRHEMGIISNRTMRVELLVANRLHVDPPPPLISSVSSSHSKSSATKNEPEAPIGLFEGDKEITDASQTSSSVPPKKERKPRKNTKSVNPAS